MHKRINFSELGGAPFDQQTLEFMQSAYSEITSGIVGLIGDNVIVSGCIVAGTSVSAGWIITSGELLPFAASETGVLETFIIQETFESLVFENAQNKAVEFKRIAMFGSNSDAKPWSGLTRLPNIKALSSTLNNHLSDKKNPHGVTKDQIGLSNIPNAKTDDPSVSDSDILASSKALASLLPDVIKRLDIPFRVSPNVTEVTATYRNDNIDLRYYDYVFSQISVNDFGLILTNIKVWNINSQYYELRITFQRTQNMSESGDRSVYLLAIPNRIL